MGYICLFPKYMNRSLENKKKKTKVPHKLEVVCINVCITIKKIEVGCSCQIGFPKIIWYV